MPIFEINTSYFKCEKNIHSLKMKKSHSKYSTSVYKNPEYLQSSKEVIKKAQKSEETALQSLKCSDLNQGVSNKHRVTPLKVKSKTSKIEEGGDVHSLDEASVTPRSKYENVNVRSPSCFAVSNAYLGFSSQEMPDVIWDPASPIHLKGKNERNVTVEDVVKCFQTDNQESKSNTCNTQSSVFNVILEKWMSGREDCDIVPLNANQRVRQKKLPRKPSRHLIEMEKLVETLSNDGEASNTTEQKLEATLEIDYNSHPLCKNAEEGVNMLETDMQLNNSIDELWGSEFDDDIIVKATQNIESCLISPCRPTHQILSTTADNVFSLQAAVPETALSTAVNKITSNTPISETSLPLFTLPSRIPEINHNFNKTQTNENKNSNILNTSGQKRFGKKIQNSTEECVSLKETALPVSNRVIQKENNLTVQNRLNFNFETENWDKDFSSDDEILSSIPDDIFLDQNSIQEEKTDVIFKSSSTSKPCFGNEASSTALTTIANKSLTERKDSSKKELQLNDKHLTEYQSSVAKQCANNLEVISFSFDSSESLCKHVDKTETILTSNNTDETDDFEDDGIFQNPELWTWADEVESQSSSTLKCTPEEIARKKAEAKAKLQKKQFGKSISKIIF